MIMTGTIGVWMREEEGNKGASGDGLALLQQLGVCSNASVCCLQTKRPQGTTAAIAGLEGRWPQGRRKVAELCNALGPRSQWGGFSFPDFSLSAELSLGLLV